MNKILGFTMMITFFLTSCSLSIFSGKMITSKGNPELKAMATLEDSIFIGVSTGEFTEEGAIENALNNSVVQVVQFLGVKTEIFTTIEQKSIFKDNNESFEQLKDIKMNWQFNDLVEVKPNEIYLETWQHKERTFYKCWVKVIFKEMEYKDFWNNFYAQQTRVLKKISIALSNDKSFNTLLLALSQLDYINKEAPKTAWIWNLKSYPEFETVSGFLKRTVQKKIGEIEFSFLESSNGRSKLLVTHNKKGIANLPLLIKTKNNKIVNLNTNELGALIIEDNFYEMDNISYLIGFEHFKSLPFWKKKYIKPNPLSKNLYKINIEERNSYSYVGISADLKKKLKN